MDKHWCSYCLSHEHDVRDCEEMKRSMEATREELRQTGKLKPVSREECGCPRCREELFETIFEP